MKLNTLFFILILLSSQLSAQDSLSRLQKQFFVDAQESEFSVDGLIQIFSGDAVIVSPALSIAAKTITINRKKKFIEASGKVTLLQSQVIMRGSKLQFILENDN